MVLVTYVTRASRNRVYLAEACMSNLAGLPLAIGNWPLSADGRDEGGAVAVGILCWRSET
jgi:hypothetical protein